MSTRGQRDWMAVFRLLEPEIEWIRTGTELDLPLGRFSELVGFSEEIFSQSLRRYADLDINGFGEDEKAEAFAKERRLDAGEQATVLELLWLFEKLCDEW